jgi:hypothetical protein
VGALVIEAQTTKITLAAANTNQTSIAPSGMLKFP